MFQRLFLSSFHAVIIACLMVGAAGLSGTARGLRAQELASIERLARQLDSPDASVQIQALDELANYGERAKETVPQVTAKLSSDNRDVRVRAARTLSAIGPAAAPAVGELTRLLQDNTPIVRAYAAYALGRIGDPAKPAVPTLVELVVDQDETVRRAVIGALRNIKESRELTIPLMVKVLQQSDPKDVLPALHTLAEAGEQALPFLKEALQHPKACYWACIVVGEMGPKAKSVIPQVAAMLDHEEAECRLQALVTLGKMGDEARSVTPQILELMKSDSLGIRYAAAYALGEIGGDEDVVAALEKSVQSDDLFLRTVSIWALNRLKPNDASVKRQAVGIIIEALQSDKPDVLSMATQTLAELGEVPEDVRDALVEAVDKADPQVVGQIIRAIAESGVEGVPRLKRALAREKVRGYAVRVMQQMGPDAAAAVPDLIEILKNEEVTPEFRQEAHFALGAVGPQAADAVPVLIAALEHKVPEVRYSACYALGNIGPAASAATPALQENLRVQDSFLRLGSVWALLRINPGNAEIAQAAAPLLAKALEDPRDHIRAEAARSLGQVGKYAQPYREKLQAALNDEDMDVRAAAAAALTKIPE